MHTCLPRILKSIAKLVYTCFCRYPLECSARCSGKMKPKCACLSGGCSDQAPSSTYRGGGAIIWLALERSPCASRGWPTSLSSIQYQYKTRYFAQPIHGSNNLSYLVFYFCFFCFFCYCCSAVVVRQSVHRHEWHHPPVLTSGRQAGAGERGRNVQKHHGLR